MWIFISVIALIVIIVIALQIPATQNFLTQKAVNFLEEKIGTSVALGEINIGFPKSIVIKDFYLEDQNQDTLLYAHRLAINIDMLGIIRQEVQINALELERITAHVYRTMPDSTFNFDYILEAFASEEEPEVEEDTTESDWDISIYELVLQDIYLTYVDEVTGNDVNLHLGSFNLEMDAFDLAENKFHVGLMELQNTRAKIVQSKIPPDEEDDEEKPDTFDYDVALDQMIVNNVNLEYQNFVSAQHLKFDLGEFQARGEDIDFPNQRIKLAAIELHNSDLHFILNENIEADSVVKEVEEASTEKEGEEDGVQLAFFLDELNLTGNRIRFNNYNEPQQERGMDFNHLDVSSLSMNIQDIEFHDQRIRAGIQQFNFNEQSGFRLENFSTNLEVDSTSASLNNLDLRTGESYIQKSLALQFPSLATIADDIDKIILDLDLDAEIGFQDIAYLQPELADAPPLAGNLHQKVNFSANMQGPVQNLRISNFEARALQATSLRMSGRVQGLPDTDNLFLDVNIPNFSTTRSDIVSLMPPETLPEGFSLPQTITLSSNFRGTLDDFETNAVLNTSDGNITADLHMEPVQGRQSFKGQVAVQEVNVGKILGQEDMGSLSLEINIDGKGMTPEDLEANIKGVVQKFEYNEYQYNNLFLDGRIEQQQFVGQATLEDENLNFAFNGNVNFNEENPVLDFIFDLEHADLQALNFMEDPFTAQFQLEADLRGTDLNEINGTFGIRDVIVNRDGERYTVDSLLFASIQEKRRTEIQIDSEIFSASLTGTVNLGDLGPTIMRHMNRYFDLHDDEIEDDLEPQNFDFEVVVHNTDLLTDVLVPDLERFIPGNISGSYDSETSNLELEIEFPQIIYQTTTIDGLRFFVDSDRSQLNYSLTLDQVLDSSYHIKNMALSGEVENNLINTRLRFLDDDEETKYLLGGVMESINDVFRFSFEPDQVILNYDSWNVPQNNFLEFGPEGFSAHDVTFERRGQVFSINSRPNLDLEVDFRNFNLSVISKMIERDENLITGELSGNVVFDNQQEALAFTSDLDISNFSFKEDTLGNISLQASNPTSNQYNVNLQISGTGNQVNVNGDYLVAEAEGAPGVLDFKVNIQKLNLETVEAYAAGQLEDLTGSLRGELVVSGTTESPQVRGEMLFEKAAFNLTMLNNHFRLENERIVFDEKGITFPNFKMIDVNNNPAVITGAITTEDFTDFQLGLDIQSRNFRLINTTEAEGDDIYFGSLILDSNISLRGTTDLPVIEGDINVENGTDMTLIIPTGEAGIADMEGIVEFVDMSKANPFEETDTLKKHSDLAGINLNLIIRTDRQARFNVLMDPSGTDALAVRGEANLNLSINPSGDMTLTGRYEIVEGSYQLAFMGVVNRRFDINPGSTLIWNGDIMDAVVDIRAIYHVRTSPINLLEGRTVDIPPQARQQFPFLVYLNMEGELMNPLISFGLDMPEDQQGAVGGSLYPIIEELNQEQQIAELNKQVFALLVLNSFLAQDPLAGGAGGGGVEGAARKSVSNLLTQQLNRLADRYISGFDLNIGVESYDDFSDTGEAAGRTELQVGISRQFLDNRLTIQVGGNIDVEGERAQQQRGVSDIAGNIVVEYNLTEDGRYRIKGFREQTYESVIEGQIVETGLGLLFTRDYNRLKDLFRKTEWEKLREEENIEVETSKEEGRQNSPAKENR